jgi:uncharacterized protein
MARVFILHGTYGTSDGNWAHWLKAELDKIGCEVIVPQFPTPEGQSLDSWMGVIEDYIDQLDGQTVVVGHSLAPVFMLSVLENIEVPIKALVSVAGWAGHLPNPDFGPLNETFFEKEFDWEKIKNNCENFVMLNSDNDPYVPFEMSEDLAKRLGVEIEVIKGGGHLNSEAGYGEFPLLLEKVKSFLPS